MMNSYYVEIRNPYDVEIDQSYLDIVQKDIDKFNHHKPFIHGSQIVTIRFAVVNKERFNDWTLLPYFNIVEELDEVIQELNSFNESNCIDWRIEKVSHSHCSLIFKTESEKILNRI